jgi:hypothetical protein
MSLPRLLVLLLLVSGACRSARGDADDEPGPERGPATLEVENQNFLDMTIYVVDGGVRQRLGEARGNSTTSFTIPERFIHGGASPLRFLADPIGEEGRPVTEEIVVEPGDAVKLVIPPG